MPPVLRLSDHASRPSANSLKPAPRRMGGKRESVQQPVTLYRKRSARSRHAKTMAAIAGSGAPFLAPLCPGWFVYRKRSIRFVDHCIPAELKSPRILIRYGPANNRTRSEIRWPFKTRQDPTKLKGTESQIYLAGGGFPGIGRPCMLGCERAYCCGNIARSSPSVFAASHAQCVLNVMPRARATMSA